MGNLPSLFGGKSNTSSQQTGQQSGSTTNPLADINFTYAQGNVLPQFSSANIDSTAARLQANQYQTGAAANQAGVAQNVMPVFNSAANMAQNGVSPASVSQWMSPYTQNVINAYNNQANINDGRTLAQAQGSNALAGGLTNSASRGNMDYLRATLGANRDAQAANLYNTGYNTAVDSAFKNAGVMNTGAGTAGALAGVQTGANVGAGNLGQLVYGANQNSVMSPYNLATQGAQTLTGMVPGVGSSYSGTSSGSSSGTSQQNPGLIQSLMGLGGLGLAGYDYGNQKGWFADGGAVEAMPRFNGHDTVGKLAETFKGLKGMLSGGSVLPKYEAGGWVPVVEKAPQEPSAEQSFASRLSGLTSAFAPYNGGDQIQQSQKALTDFMGRMPQQNALPKFADGGSTIRPMSPEAQFGAALLAGSPIAGTGDAMLKMQQHRIQEEQYKAQLAMEQARLAQQAQIATGKVMVNGVPTQTLEGQRTPAQIAQMEAHSEGAQNRIMQNRSDYEALVKWQSEQREQLQKVNEQETMGTISKAEADAIRASIQSQQPPRNPFPAPVKRGTWVPGQGVKMGP